MTGHNDFAVAETDHDDDPERLPTRSATTCRACTRQKSAMLGEELMRNLEAQVMLRIIDTRWMAHLQEMDYLKTGIGLRALRPARPAWWNTRTRPTAPSRT